MTQTAPSPWLRASRTLTLISALGAGCIEAPIEDETEATPESSSEATGASTAPSSGKPGSSKPDSSVSNSAKPDAVPTATSGRPPGTASSPQASARPSASAQTSAPLPQASTSPSSVASQPAPVSSNSGRCSLPLPARAQVANVSTPASVVGTGTAASCNFSALKTAATKGGVIVFDCGAEPVTIAVTETLKLPTDKDSVLDGGKKITLDGQGKVQLLRFESNDFQKNTHSLTLQRLTLVNGKATPTEAIPKAPAPCSQGFNDGEGGALYLRDASLNVIDCQFKGNRAAEEGPDTGGGAIYALGSKNGVVIANCTFDGNSASNAGAVGGLFAELNIYNSLFTNNKAVGHDANGADQTKCSVMNNDQYETGSGGNGGAIYSDGGSVNVLICGTEITHNSAGMNAFGGGLFFTSNDYGGTLTIQDSTLSDNTGGSWTQVKQGSQTNAGTAVGTNTKQLSLVNSQVQGVK